MYLSLKCPKSLIKMTSFEEKNNLLIQENENLKQYAKSVEKELELQEYNVFNLKGELANWEKRFNRLSAKKCGKDCIESKPLHKAFESLCKTIQFKGTIDQVEEKHIARYRSQENYSSDAFENGFLLFNYIEDRRELAMLALFK